jgi:acetylornithine deacetylase/succinyl-diaminopimelate desuccinylase-like protein
MKARKRMAKMSGFRPYIEKNRGIFLRELQALCRIPSVAGNEPALAKSAELVAGHLSALGAETRVFKIQGGPPMVYGEVGRGNRTLLVYNHYDVQPPEPLDMWSTGPFSAEIVGGRLYGRGVSDNKGNLMARIHALRAYLASVGPLPLRVKFLIDGEEETNSRNLNRFVKDHSEMLRADGCLWECSWKDLEDRPVIACGLKGLCYVELCVRGARHDLHSSYASIVPNPAWRLVWALSSLMDGSYGIKIKGWREEGEPPGEADQRALEKIPFNEETFKELFGLAKFIRDMSGGELMREYLYAPTCTICGLRAGYTGGGAKTVLPSHAVAKLDFRLVPGMTPEKLLEYLRRHLDTSGFPDVEIKYLNSAMPAMSDCEDHIVKAAAEALRRVCGKEPIVYPLAPWSGPLYDVCHELHIPSVAFGIGNAESRDHAPNENIRLSDYFEGIRCMAEFIGIYGGA